jgi:hypothetical protein
MQTLSCLSLRPPPLEMVGQTDQAKAAPEVDVDVKTAADDVEAAPTLNSLTSSFKWLTTRKELWCFYLYYVVCGRIFFVYPLVHQES